MTDTEPHHLESTPDPDDLVTLTTAATSFGAHAIAGVLESEGLPVFVFDTAAIGLGIPLAHGKTSVPVQVRRGDLERAGQLLEQNVSDSIDIDWDDVDVGRREDDLPLHSPDRTPIAAQIAFLITVVVVGAAIASGVVMFLGFW